MNSTTVVRTDFETAARRIAAAVLWANLFESKGTAEARKAAAEERRLASYLADCICRSDFRQLNPPDDWQPRF